MTLKKMTHKFIIDTKHKVILRAIQKSGCTSWKTLLILNSLKRNQTARVSPHNWRLISHAYGFKLTRSMEKSEIISVLTSYYNILTVRHPLSRLESAFKDLNIRRRKALQKTPLTDSKLAEMFERQMVKLSKKAITDEHWKPIVKHTNPCSIHFE